MNNYKNTLNLPKTKFPMKGNLVIKELEILKKWKNNNIYNCIRESRKGKKIFILHDGPPYANGYLHIGHAVNKIIKDIIIKSKNSMCIDAPYIVGWDCHGLPIESIVEKNKKKIYSDFRLECKNYVIKQIKKQKNDFIRLGVFSDWNNPYLTMNYSTQANTIRTLNKIIKLKYLELRNKPVYWCIKCESNLSEMELKYNDNHISLSLYIKFKINNIFKIENLIKKNKINNEFIYLIAWTTTPWTIIDNKAILMNPNIYYSLVNINKEYFIVADNLLNKILKDFNKKKFIIISKILGKNFKDIICYNPIYNNKIPIILDENVEYNIGTAIVHVAPGHGSLDYEIGIKYKLDITNSINKEGKFKEKTHIKLDNLNVFKSIKQILKILKENNELFSKLKFKHKYPYCYRHNYPIIFRTTQQWFINLDKNNLREKALNESQKVKWIPKWGKSYIKKMLSSRFEWCISRQRKWGIPITIFIHKITKKIHPNTTKIMEEIANLVEKNGSIFWWKLDIKDFLKEDFNNYEKVLDVLDVWFDSGSTFFSIIKQNKKFNKKKYIDLCVEGVDQYRGWFMSLLLISVAITNKTPYKEIISHSFVIDKFGNKISKSVKHDTNLRKLIKTFGSDIIRLWVANSDYRKNLTISNEILKRTSDIYRKIRNTLRFLLSNLYDFNPKNDIVEYENLVKLDEWIINKTYLLYKNIISLYKKYKFHNIVENIMKFCVYLGSNYLENIKDRQYTLNKDSLARKSSQTSIYYIINSIVKLLSPILSFTCDEIWDFIPGNKNSSIFLEDWNFDLIKNINIRNFKYNEEFWNLIFSIKYEINKKIEILKLNKLVSSNLQLHVILHLENNLFNKLKFISNELKYIFNTSIVDIISYDFLSKEKSNIKGLYIELNIINGVKCNRCWNYFYNKKDINDDICIRCINNINKINEIRKFI